MLSWNQGLNWDYVPKASILSTAPYYLTQMAKTDFWS